LIQQRVFLNIFVCPLLFNISSYPGVFIFKTACLFFYDSWLFVGE
jgi:hypothetical protein